MPYSDSLVSDRKSGYDRLLISRSNAYVYSCSKYLVSGLSGGICITLPLLLFLVICFLLFPHVPVAEVRLPELLFSGIFLENEWLYCFIVIVHTFVFSFVYSTVGLAMSIVSWNRFTALLGPAIFVYSVSVVLGFIPYNKLNLTGLSPLYFFAFLSPSSTIVGNYIEMAIVMIVSGLFYFIRWNSFVKKAII